MAQKRSSEVEGLKGGKHFQIDHRGLRTICSNLDKGGGTILGVGPYSSSARERRELVEISARILETYPLTRLARARMSRLAIPSHQIRLTKKINGASDDPYCALPRTPRPSSARTRTRGRPRMGAELGFARGRNANAAVEEGKGEEGAQSKNQPIARLPSSWPRPRLPRLAPRRAAPPLAHFNGHLAAKPHLGSVGIFWGILKTPTSDSPTFLSSPNEHELTRSRTRPEQSSRA